MFNINKGFYVYLYYDINGNLLYLGRTVNLDQRFREHFYGNKQNEHEYINKVSSIQYVEFPTESEMLAFEAFGIDNYKPLFNKKIENINYSMYNFNNIYLKQYIYGFNPNPFNRIIKITTGKCVIESIVDDNFKRLCPDCFTNEYYECKDGRRVCKFCGKTIMPSYVQKTKASDDKNMVKKRFILELIPKKRILEWKQAANSINGFFGKEFQEIQ